ncbi:1-acylglycerol-3-phosphate O [Backusella circina FSU 941]|nr:1-acylglycerol-3-phosphate O [Backusella circina FSU 941]
MTLVKSGLVAAAVFSVLILGRKNGNFYYRSVITTLCLTIMAIYGMCASIIFPPLGLTHLINSSVARGYYTLGRLFLDLKVDSEGEENLKKVEGPVIYVCNHQSSLDIMFMGKVYPQNTAIVAKKELKYYPFLGWFMTLSNAIFLDRKNKESAIKQARQAAQDIHKKNTCVWIFPEGTRGHEAEINLLPFKKGAFHMAVQARVPIVPVVIGNYYDLYSAKEKRSIPGKLRCKVLPPISTKDIKEDSADIEKLANHCRDQMLVALKEITYPRAAKKVE